MFEKTKNWIWREKIERKRRARTKKKRVNIEG